MKNKNLGLFIQCVLCSCIAIFLIISIFESSFISVSQMLAALTLFVMAYNNHMVYKKKYFTVAYAAFGLFLLISTLVGI